MSTSDDVLKQKLWKIFKLKHFVNTKQKEAVKAILKRDKDVVVSMGPGNRKSLCFQLPNMMQENKITIVCSASTSSIKDEIYHLKKIKIVATLITAQMSDDERERLTQDVTDDKPTNRFIYVQPELVSSDFFTNILHTLSTNDKLAYFAVEDAHSASPRHQDFCQDYLKFGSLRPAYPSVPWIALTHNASVDVRNDIVRNLQLREPILKFTKSTFRKNLHHDIIFKNTILIDLFAHLKNFLTTRLEADGDDIKKPCGIIYCKNRETVDMVVGELTKIGFSTKGHHGGMSSSARKKVLDDWLNGALPVITATTSFGAGIEKSTVRVVVHFGVPHSIIRFYKESGIVGLDGKLSYSRIYYCESDVAEVDSALKSAIAKSNNENDRRRALRAHADFLKMIDLCETVYCRHKIFCNCFDDAEPNCKDKCDVCTNPDDAKVALGLFQQFSAKRSNQNMPTYSPVIIKSEPNDPVNGQSSEHPTASPSTFRPARSVSPSNTIIKEENAETGNQGSHLKRSDELFAMKTLPPRNVSPARTIIKEEPVIRIKQEAEDNLNNSGAERTSRCVSPAETVIVEKSVRSTLLSDELFAMQTLPPGNVSPARTMIKEETEVESNGANRHFENGASSVWDVDRKAGIRLLSPPRCVSPAETVIDEKSVENTTTARHDALFSVSDSPNEEIPGGADTHYRVIVKSEPKSPIRPIDESNSEPLERAISPLLPLTATEKTNLIPAELTNPIGPILNTSVTSGNGPVLTIINQEAPNTQHTDAESRIISERESHSPSPTGTIVKDECLSPARNADFGVDALEDISDTSQDGEVTSEMLNVDSSKGQNSRTERLHVNPKATTKPPAKNLETITDSSSELTLLSSEIVDFREKSSSTTDDRGSTPGHSRMNDSSRRRSRSRSRSDERFKRENKSRKRSRSNNRVKREKTVRRRSRSRSLSSRSRSAERLRRENGRSRRSCSRSRSRSNDEFNRRRRSRSQSVSSGRSSSKERLKCEKGKRRRSRSNERLKREKSVDRKPTSSSNSKRSQTSSRSDQKHKRQRNSNDSDRNDPTPTASTSTRGNPRDLKWTNRRFSVTPEKRTEYEDDDDEDYGWEDPAPPKPKLEKQQRVIQDDVNIQQKLKDFESKLQDEKDHDLVDALKVTEELQLALRRKIEESYTRKFNNLGHTIQKKQDDYFYNLFGTNNFDNWDDEPALSNVNNVKKLQPFKEHVPDALPLYDKMSMKHEINTMKLQPTRDGNVVVFKGKIKEIENEYQGREMPRHLVEQLKQEKEAIAELVKKYLMPYFHVGRIQTKELYTVVARDISRHFYDNAGDESSIQRYVDDMFYKYGTTTAAIDF